MAGIYAFSSQNAIRMRILIYRHDDDPPACPAPASPPLAVRARTIEDVAISPGTTKPKAA